MKLPTDAPRNQTPIIEPTIRGGARVVIELRPTGLRQSSAHVCSRYTPHSQSGLASAPEVDPDDALAAAAGTSSTNPRPTPIRPNANLVGADGWRVLSVTHI